MGAAPETDTGQTGHCSTLSLVIGANTFPVRNKDYKSFVSSSNIVSEINFEGPVLIGCAYVTIYHHPNITARKK